MSSLGEKIKSVFSGGDHSETSKEEAEHRTPGAFPSDETSGTRGGVDQPHIGGKPVPSSGTHDLGGTSRDPGMITGTSEHNKLHKKEDPRSNTGYPSQEHSSTAGHGHMHTGAGTSASSSQYPTSNTQSEFATDRHGRPDTSQVPGTGVATGAGTAGGIHASELGSDRSGTKTDNFTSGLEGQRAGNNAHGATSGLPGSRGSSGLTGTQHGSTGSSTGQYGTSGTQPQSGTHSGTGTGLAAGAAGAAGAAALGSRDRDSHNTVHSGTEKSNIGSGSHEEPYWGDLPSDSRGSHGTQNTGVYNTVTGHGSGENTSSQHRNLPLRTGGVDDTPRTGTSGSTQGLTPGAGVYNSVTGHGSNNEQNRSHNTTSGTGITGTSSNPLSSSTDDSQRNRHQGEGALGAGAAGAAAGYAASKLGHDNNPQRIGESGTTSNNLTTSHGNNDGASYLPNTSNSSGVTGDRTGSIDGAGARGGAGVLGGATATPQQQTIAGGQDPRTVAASQPTTHKSGSMLDVGEVGTGSAHNTAGPHKSDALNKADPRVDSDLDGSKTYGGNQSSHTGRDAAGLGAAGAAAGAYGVHEHNKHGREHEGQRGLDSSSGISHNTAGPHSSNTANRADPRIDSDRDGSKTYGGNQSSSHTGRDAAGLGAAGAAAGAYGVHEHNKHGRDQNLGSGIDSTHTDSRSTDRSSGGGLLHRHNDEPTTTGHSHQATKENYNDPSGHHHDSNVLGFLHHNKDDHLTGQEAHGSALPGTTHSLGSGNDNIGAGHDGHTGRNVALAGGAAGAGYGASRLAQHHNEPSIGQRDHGLTGTSGTTGTTEGAHGPHASRVANAADPRVDSDRDGSRGLGSNSGTHGTAGAHNDSHTGRNLAGLGAAAGAGYGASRVGHHDSVPRDASSNTSGSGQYNTLNDGTPSGIATGANHGTSTGISDTRGAPTSTGISGGSHSHGGHDQYNTLSSGTPSGVSVGDERTGGSSHTNIGSGSTGYNDSSKHGLGSGVGTGSAAGGLAAAASSKLRSGGKVTHNCTKCGEENDISKYFHQ